MREHSNIATDIWQMELVYVVYYFALEKNNSLVTAAWSDGPTEYWNMCLSLLNDL